jgi:diphthamide biosynthesis methyltransferase
MQDVLDYAMNITKIPVFFTPSIYESYYAMVSIMMPMLSNSLQKNAGIPTPSWINQSIMDTIKTNKLQGLHSMFDTQVKLCNASSKCLILAV